MEKKQGEDKMGIAEKILAMFSIVCVISLAVMFMGYESLYLEKQKLEEKYINDTAELKERIVMLKSELNESIQNYTACAEKNRILQSRLSESVRKNGITLSEVKEFIKNDPTDEYIYTDETACLDYAYTLVRHFIDHGIYACVVYILFRDTAHTLVAVNTTQGVVYIEPQEDRIIYSLKIGEDYCKKLGWWCEGDMRIRRVVDCFNV